MKDLLKRITPKVARKYDRWSSVKRWESDGASGRFIVRRTVEHMVAEHCNLLCKGCDHSSPDLPNKLSPLDQFASDIDALKGVLRVRSLKLTGGEPLLHPDIVSFARIAKTSGIARDVELWTNGLLLHKATADLFENVDTIHVTRYPGVKILMKKARMEEIARTHGVRFNIEYKARFLETHLESPNHDAARNQEVFRECKNSHVWNCHTIQEGHYFKCSRAEILRRRALIPRSVDGVPLHAPDLRGRLEGYLSSTAPLAACAWCLGTSGEYFPHRQLNKSERSLSTEKRKSWPKVEETEKVS